MGRPAASEENKRLAVAFARAVTVPSEDPTLVVARSGRLSIFAALAECCPACIRSDTSASNRSGLTVIEMNKTLEKEGFHKMRDRRSDATTREIDPTGAGLCLFSFLRWVAPDSKSECKKLSCAWQHLADRFPAFRKECDFKTFQSVISRFKTEWEPYTGSGRRMAKITAVRDRFHDPISLGQQLPSLRAGSPTETASSAQSQSEAFSAAKANPRKRSIDQLSLTSLKQKHRSSTASKEPMDLLLSALMADSSYR